MWQKLVPHIVLIRLNGFLKCVSFPEKLENWSILSEGGDKFTIEQPPSGSEKIPHDANLENDLDDSCFATSFHSCSKEQTIQLSRLGLTPEVMDDYKPCITFTDWYVECNIIHGN